MVSDEACRPAGPPATECVHYPQPVTTPPPRQEPALPDPRRHTGAKVLSAAIYREAEKKGADIMGERPLPQSVKRCPDLVTEFYRHIVERLLEEAEQNQLEQVALPCRAPP